MQPLTLRQVVDALQALAAGDSHVTWRPEWDQVLRTVFPGMPVQLILPLEEAVRQGEEPEAAPVEVGDTGSLAPASLTWGFLSPSDPKRTVFNTRIETAARDLTRGWGFWTGPVSQGRCVVPCRSFYEPSQAETYKSPRTGRPIKRQYEFRSPGQEVTYLAAVQQDGRFSVVTTEPNADMEGIHPRMPLVLEPSELPVWLGPDFLDLRDRSRVRLESRPEPVPPAPPKGPSPHDQPRLF